MGRREGRYVLPGGARAMWGARHKDLLGSE